MLLAGLILLAACANLGSLFAARAADRSREVALRLALGSSRRRILRQLFTEAMLISLVGGALGLCGQRGAVARAERVAARCNRAPLRVPVNPDANVYLVALLLALVSGFLFGAVPVRQVLRTNPYRDRQVGIDGQVGRRITVRDLLLVVQIAICAVLVTSSLVAVRGLVRSLHSNFGFEPRNAMLVEHRSEHGRLQRRQRARNAKAHDRCSGGDSRRTVGGIGRSAAVALRRERRDCLYRQNDGSASLSNAAAEAMTYNISPEYFDAARTPLCWRAGLSPGMTTRTLAARGGSESGVCQNKIFGSADQRGGRILQAAGWNAHPGGGHCRRRKVCKPDRRSAAGDVSPRSAIAVQLDNVWWCARTAIRSNLAAAIKSTLRELDAGLPITISTWNQELDGAALFASRMATMSLGVLGVMGAMLSITGIFGMAAYSVSKRLRELGIRIALGAQRTEVLQAALGRAFKLLAFGSAAGLLLGMLATRVLAYIVYQATPRDPLVLAGVVLAMVLLGLLATWIPAQRALSVDPLILLREE